jgi:hypothetical protein
MNINIPLENCFQVPEGNYKAVLTAIHHLAAKDKVRFVFEIIDKHPKRGRYVAGKNYDISLAKGSQLREDLASWRGHDITDEELDAGAVDFEKFIGREGDIQIRHVANESHKQPFCYIATIYPSGTLIQTPARPVLQPAFCEI